MEILGTMIIALPCYQRPLKCREVHYSAPLNGGSCICNGVIPLRGNIGELISDITYTSNLGNVAIEVMNDFFVLGHIETQMIGDDRPYFIGPGDDV